MTDLTPDEFAAWLEEHNACRQGREWAAGKSLRVAWAECDRPEWLVWLAGVAGIEPRRLVRVALDCARSVERLLPDDPRPRKALALVERWLAGESVTSHDLWHATYGVAAAAAAAAAYAAEAAAAGNPTNAAAAAASAAARAGNPADVLAIVRRHFTADDILAAIEGGAK